MSNDNLVVAKSWYKFDISKLSDNQSNYCKFLTQSFNVADPYMQPIPYVMTPYQIELHSQSFNVLRENALHILQIKARGTSFTYSSLIELIMTASMFDKQIIPIISQDERGGLDSLDVAKWLIANSNIKELKEDALYTEKGAEIRFKSTGSVIKVYPSSSAGDAIRGRRLIRGLIDEFAFQQNDKKLWAASENCMQSGVGQFLVGSTPCGRQNMFFELVNRTRTDGKEIGFYLMETPVFDPKIFNRNKSILEQPELVSVAPWIVLKKLEVKRRADVNVFMQEQQCDFLDDSLSFISYATIMRCVRDRLYNVKDYIERDASFRYTETDNPIYIACDVAEKTDLFAVTAFEEITTEEGTYYLQRYLDYFNGKRIPELEAYMNDLIRVFPNTVSVRVDETGLGTGLVGYLKKKWGSLIVGINFASTIKIGANKDTAPIRKVMITNLRRMMEDKQVYLLEDALQVKHINSIDYSFKVPNNSGDGHSDILWANAMCLIKSKYSIFKGGVVTARLKEEKDKPEPGKQMNIAQKLKYLQKNGKKANYF